MKFIADSDTWAAVMPGLYSADPMPKPSAPAARYAAMLAGVMPPTGSSSAPSGNTARNAFTAAGVTISAGNSLSPLAPAPRSGGAPFAGAEVPSPQASSVINRTDEARTRRIPKECHENTIDGAMPK